MQFYLGREILVGLEIGFKPGVLFVEQVKLKKGNEISIESVELFLFIVDILDKNQIKGGYNRLNNEKINGQHVDQLFLVRFRVCVHEQNHIYSNLADHKYYQVLLFDSKLVN